MSTLRRFLSPFVLIFTLILVLGCGLIGHAIATHTAHWAVLVVLSASIWILPAVFWTSDREDFSKFATILQFGSFLAMGFLSSLLVVGLAHGLVATFLAIVWQPSLIELSQTLLPFTEGNFAFLWAALFMACGVFWALRGPRIKYVKLPIEGLPENLNGFKIAHLTDLHVGITIGPRYVTKTVNLVKQINPNITVLTGDIVDGNIGDLKPSLDILGTLAPQGQVFYVPGNHEYYWTLPPWMQELQSKGFQVLINKGAEIIHAGERVWIAGIPDPAAAQFGQEKPDPQKSLGKGSDASFKILLSHRPNYADMAAKLGFHLQLSGHTHGGQFFPWTFVARFVHKYFVGLKRVDKTWLYINPGTGSWGPPIRIGTTPEVTCLQLVAVKS